MYFVACRNMISIRQVWRLRYQTVESTTRGRPISSSSTTSFDYFEYQRPGSDVPGEFVQLVRQDIKKDPEAGEALWYSFTWK